MSYTPTGRPPGRPRKYPLPTVEAEQPTVELAVEAIAEEPAEAEEHPNPRPEMRPVMREEDSRTRAARRAAELRDHGAVMEEGTDDFYIPLDEIPPGWTYEWKRWTTFGAEDPAYQVQLARQGWEAVPAKRHPSFMPDGQTTGRIERKGMILMERPQEITADARERELRRARSQVRTKEEQLSMPGSGEFGRENKGESLVNIRKTYERMPIPD